MILIISILILLTGGLLAWASSYVNKLLPRIISLIALSGDMIYFTYFWLKNLNTQFSILNTQTWLLEYQHSWIPQFGISLHFSMDGLSLVLILLTLFLGIISVLVSWKEIDKQVGFFHFNMMWILAGIMGVFLATDLILFLFFWEMMLIPMYFLIGIWGHENRIYASYKFFIYTQSSGLLMFIAILGLYFIHGRQTGNYTFDYSQLIGTVLSPKAAMLLMSGFMIAFIVKLPVVPLHNWLPDAHTEAPTAGSVILAGLLLKTGAYGLLRFVIPLFPGAANQIAPYAMGLGIIGILYGAMLAYSQTDFKRLVAYTSVSHMGFIMLGVFAFNEIAFQGVVMQMLAHGISTGALFVIVGTIKERIHTRELDQMGGMWELTPRIAGVTLLFTMASLGLPGLGNFVAEYLTLSGAFSASKILVVIASLGLIASAIYSLRIMQKTFYGRKSANIEKLGTIKDYGLREMIIIFSLIITIFWLGLYPGPIIKTSERALRKILNTYNISQKSETKNIVSINP